MGSSYTVSNFTRVTHFLDSGFLLELMVRKTLLPINIYCLSPQLTYLILQRESNTCISFFVFVFSFYCFSLLIYLGLIKCSKRKGYQGNGFNHVKKGKDEHHDLEEWRQSWWANGHCVEHCLVGLAASLSTETLIFNVMSGSRMSGTY